MRVTISAVLAVTVLVLAACGSDTPRATPTPSFTTTTTGMTTTMATTTTEVVSAAAAPPPAAFADVEGEYNQRLEALMVAGRATVDLVLADDPEALHAKFDASMAAELSVDELRTTLAGVFAEAPLTGRGADRAFPQSAAVGLYRAELEWGDETLTMTAFFDEAGDIMGLNLQPLPVLPADPAVGYESEVAFRLPFEGLWFVFWGGDTAGENYHVVAPDQRHAYDVVVWKDGGTHTGDASVNENYWAYGQRVLAPADGTVVTVVDGLPDQVPEQGSDAANPAGNHVVIEVDDGEYLLIAHMQPGSLTVAQGDVVERGQQVGLVGNSGNTSEPHIHIHLQDKPTFDPAAATGLPLEFTGYIADGVSVESGQPVADQFIVDPLDP